MLCGFREYVNRKKKILLLLEQITIAFKSFHLWPNDATLGYSDSNVSTSINTSTLAYLGSQSISVNQIANNYHVYNAKESGLNKHGIRQTDNGFFVCQDNIHGYKMRSRAGRGEGGGGDATYRRASDAGKAKLSLKERVQIRMKNLREFSRSDEGLKKKDSGSRAQAIDMSPIDNTELLLFDKVQCCAVTHDGEVLSQSHDVDFFDSLVNKIESLRDASEKFAFCLGEDHGGNCTRIFGSSEIMTCYSIGNHILAVYTSRRNTADQDICADVLREIEEEIGIHKENMLFAETSTNTIIDVLKRLLDEM